MADRGLFRGHALQGIDAKGRVGIPAPLRATIERNAGEKILLLGVHGLSGCLVGADSGLSQIDYQRMLRDEDRSPADASERNAAARRAFGMAHELPFDASGRFILPPFLRQKAGLDDQAFFLGVGERFEIWAPERLLADLGVPDDVKEMVEYYRAERGAA